MTATEYAMASEGRYDAIDMGEQSSGVVNDQAVEACYRCAVAVGEQDKAMLAYAVAYWATLATLAR